MKVLVGIPAFNEEKMIGKVIRSLPKRIKGVKKIDLLVVDDGSEDETREIAKDSGSLVLSHLINRGLGGSLKTIFTYAKKKNYDILVTFDADGQHKASDLPRILDPVLKKKKDVVIGTRWKNVRYVPFSRLVLNRLANIVTFFLFGVWTSDSQSGFRAFGKKAIKVIRLQTDGMEVSSEFFREIYMNKLKFGEIPINVIYSDYSKSKGQKLSNAPNVFFQLLLRLLR